MAILSQSQHSSLVQLLLQPLIRLHSMSLPMVATPFKTITQAQKAVRAINGTMTGDISVILRGGTYQLSSTVNFTEADGGKDGFYVRYKAYPNETPLITGGIPMSGWTIHDEKNNIWKVEGVDARFSITATITSSA